MELSQNLPIIISGTIFTISLIFLIILWIVRNKKEKEPNMPVSNPKIQSQAGASPQPIQQTNQNQQTPLQQNQVPTVSQQPNIAVKTPAQKTSPNPVGQVNTPTTQMQTKQQTQPSVPQQSPGIKNPLGSGKNLQKINFGISQNKQAPTKQPNGNQSPNIQNQPQTESQNNNATTIGNVNPQNNTTQQPANTPPVQQQTQTPSTPQTDPVISQKPVQQTPQFESVISNTPNQDEEKPKQQPQGNTDVPNQDFNLPSAQ